MDGTFRQPLQTEQGLTENLNLSYEYPTMTVKGKCTFSFCYQGDVVEGEEM